MSVHDGGRGRVRTAPTTPGAARSDTTTPDLTEPAESGTTDLAGADHAISPGGSATTRQNGVVAQNDVVARGWPPGGGTSGDSTPGNSTDVPDWRGDDVPGWAGGVMAVLRVLTRLVEVNLLVLAGTLAGGVLLGLGPALKAGSAVLHDPGLAMEPWRGFWREWRTDWRRSNLLFAPFWPAGTLLWADAAAVGQATGLAHAAMLAGFTLASAWTAVVLAWWPRVVLRYDDAAPAIWRYLLLTPLMAPGVALAALITLAATAATILGVPPAGLAAGAAFPLWAIGRLVDGKLEKTPDP